MHHPTLRALIEDEFLVDYGLLGNPRALQSALARSSQIAGVRGALSSGELDEAGLRRFVGELLRELRIGTLFPYDISLAAIAVAIRSRPTPFAEEYLGSLAELELAELPMSIRVAREAKRVRRNLPGNKFAKFDIARTNSLGDLAWRSFAPFQEPLIGKSYPDLAIGGGNAEAWVLRGVRVLRSRSGHKPNQLVQYHRGYIYSLARRHLPRWCRSPRSLPCPVGIALTATKGKTFN